MKKMYVAILLEKNGYSVYVSPQGMISVKVCLWGKQLVEYDDPMFWELLTEDIKLRVPMLTDPVYECKWICTFFQGAEQPFVQKIQALVGERASIILWEDVYKYLTELQHPLNSNKDNTAKAMFAIARRQDGMAGDRLLFVMDAKRKGCPIYVNEMDDSLEWKAGTEISNIRTFELTSLSLSKDRSIFAEQLAVKLHTDYPGYWECNSNGERHYEHRWYIGVPLYHHREERSCDLFSREDFVADLKRTGYFEDCHIISNHEVFVWRNIKDEKILERTALFFYVDDNGVEFVSQRGKTYSEQGYWKVYGNYTGISGFLPSLASKFQRMEEFRTKKDLPIYLIGNTVGCELCEKDIRQIFPNAKIYKDEKYVNSMEALAEYAKKEELARVFEERFRMINSLRLVDREGIVRELLPYICREVCLFEIEKMEEYISRNIMRFLDESLIGTLLPAFTTSGKVRRFERKMRSKMLNWFMVPWRENPEGTGDADLCSTIYLCHRFGKNLLKERLDWVYGELIGDTAGYAGYLMDDCLHRIETAMIEWLKQLFYAPEEFQSRKVNKAARQVLVVWENFIFRNICGEEVEANHRDIVNLEEWEGKKDQLEEWIRISVRQAVNRKDLDDAAAELAGIVNGYLDMGKREKLSQIRKPV